MAQIRVGTRAWKNTEPATTVEETVSGIGIEWVEVDGVRVPDVVSVKIELLEGFAIPVFSVKMIGPLHIVYCDMNGDPLPGEPVESNGDQFAGREVGAEFIIP